MLQDDRQYYDSAVVEGDVKKDKCTVDTHHVVTDEHFQEDLKILTTELKSLQDTVFDSESSKEDTDDDIVIIKHQDKQLSMSDIDVKSLTQRQKDALTYLKHHAFIKNKTYRQLYKSFSQNSSS